MARQAKLSNKIVNLLVSLTFLLTQLGIDIKPAHSALPQALPLPLPSEITIPEAYGKITEAFNGDSGKMVFHIQDLHTNPEAQLNSAKIMEYLINTYGVKLLTIEGESGPIDPEWLANVSLIKIINDKMAEIFLNSGEMTGEEYLYVTQYPKYKDVTFWGIENKDSYWKNREVFNRMHPKIRENLRLCDSIKGSLDKLKKAIYPQAAVELDEKRTSYEARELEVKDYTSYLVDLAKEKGVDISKYENFSILAKLVDIQEKLEFSKVDKERTLLFDALGKTLSEEQARQMMDNVKAHNEGKATAIEFYTYLKNLAQDNNIDFAQYPNINTYMEYISTSDQLNNNELFKELDQVEDALVSSLLTTDEQKRLAQLSKMLNIMKKFFDINLSNEDLGYYEKNKAEFKVQTFTDFIKEKAKQYNVRTSSDPAISQLDKTLLEQDEFYKVVLIRDEAMVANTIKKMDETGTNITIQPIGGFHTKGMAKMYKERGISYVVISPHVTKEFDEENYRNILLNKKKSPEELVSEYSGKLRPEGMATGDQARPVSLAIQLTLDMVKDAKAVVNTINPDLLRKKEVQGKLGDIGKAAEDMLGMAEPVTFTDLTDIEKQFYKDFGIADENSGLKFTTGFGVRGATFHDGTGNIHRWMGLVGAVYLAAGMVNESRRIAKAIKRIKRHEEVHAEEPDEANEFVILTKEIDVILKEATLEDREEAVEGFGLLPAVEGPYKDFIATSVNEDTNVAREAMTAMIPQVATALKEVPATSEELMAQMRKAVEEGDPFAIHAREARLPEDSKGSLIFDVATLLGKAGPRDLAGINSIADKLGNRQIIIANTLPNVYSNSDIEYLLGLRGSGLDYLIVLGMDLQQGIGVDLSNVDQIVALEKNLLAFFAGISSKRKPIIVRLGDRDEESEPAPVISIYSILLALGLDFNVAALGALAGYIQKGSENSSYSAIIGAQPAQTFGEQYNTFLAQRRKK